MTPSCTASWQVAWKGDCTVFLKSLSGFHMLRGQKPEWEAWSKPGVTASVHSQATLYGKILAGHSQQPPAWLNFCQSKMRQASPFGKWPEEGALLLGEDPPGREETNRVPLYFPSPFKPASAAVVVFLLFCLILSLSSLWTIDPTMVLSKWFHRLLFRHSTFNISILSFCFHTKGALLQYNVLRIMSMSSNGF